MRIAAARRWRLRWRRRSRCAAPTIPTRRRDRGADVETRRTRREDESRVEETQLVVEEQVPDDRDSIAEGDRLVLIVEDDVTFASILLDMAHDKGFKGVVATRGESGLQLAKRYRPDAITLDIALPDMEGWTVLDRLKHDKSTRHIPVHIISGDDETARGLKLGAFAQVQKPVTKEALDEAFAKIKGFVDRPNKSLLIIEDNEQQRSAIAELIGGDGDVDITSAASGEEALQILREPPLRLHGPRPRPPRHERLRVHQPHAQRARRRRHPDRGLHRPRADEEGGDGAEADGRGHHREGCALAGAAARRDRALPPPRRSEPAGAEAADPRATARVRSGAGRQEGADRRRRHAQHLRADVSCWNATR